MESYASSPSSARGLLRLPLEIITMICMNLCVHCYPLGPKEQIREYYGLAGFRALVMLCKTSRMLYDIAQPLLYHCFYFPSVPRQVPRLFDVLHKRPDLVSNIKNIRRYTNNWPIAGEYHPDFMEVMKATARRLGMQRIEDPNFDCLEEREEIRGEFFFEVLVAMSSKLESLRLRVELTGLEPESRFYFLNQRVATLGPAAAMTHLKHLHIEQGTRHKCRFNTPAIVALLAVSPNLEQLRLEGCSGALEGSGPIFQDSAARPLRAIQIHDSILEDTPSSRALLNNIASHAPNLESFIFIGQKAWTRSNLSAHLPFAGFIEGLKLVMPSLLSLQIDLTFNVFERLRRGAIGDGVMHSFTSLENLSIDDPAVCRHRDRPTSEPTCLVNNIPPRLRTLTIRMCEDSRAWDDLVRLGTEVSRFPNLTKVTLMAISQGFAERSPFGLRATAIAQQIELKEIFRSGGVEFVVDFPLDHHSHRMELDLMSVFPLRHF